MNYKKINVIQKWKPYSNKSKTRWFDPFTKKCFEKKSSYDQLVANIINKISNCYFNLIKHCQCNSVTYFIYCVKHNSRNIMCFIFSDKISLLTIWTIIALSSVLYLPDTFQKYTGFISKKCAKYVKKPIVIIP